LSRQERAKFRAMAEHPDAVEEVIAEPTDERPETSPYVAR
jgi:hypothetical protein